MTYVISDIHGNLEKFNEILEKIHFTDNDVMYVIGDIVDMGDAPMELLCDLSMRYNVIPIVGDHDLTALRLLRELDKVLRGGASPDPEIMGELTDWIRKGGAHTIEGFKELDDEMKEGVLEYLEELSLYEEVEVRGKKYLAISIPYVALMAASRNYFMVHYPTDVIAGAVVGTIGGIIAYLIVLGICRAMKKHENTKFYRFMVDFDVIGVFRRKK